MLNKVLKVKNQIKHLFIDKKKQENDVTVIVKLECDKEWIVSE